MSTIMIRVPKDKTHELKSMISEGLHIFGRAMSLAEEMCEGEMHYPQYPMYDPYMGERRGRSSRTGRYTSM